MASAEQILEMAAVIETLNGELGALRTEVVRVNQELNMLKQNPPRQPEPHHEGGGRLVDKSMVPDKFTGTTSFNNWADDVKAIVGAKKVAYRRMLEWAEERKDEAITDEEVDLHEDGARENSGQLYTFLLFYTTLEPRQIVKGCRGNGAEAWRRLKHRFDPDNAQNQIGAMIRSLMPPKVKDLKLLNYAIEKWEEGLRKQQEVTGEAPLTDSTKRALLINMVPDDLGKYLKLNAGRLNSYDKARWEVMNYITNEAPQADIGMQVDNVDETGAEEWTAEWPEWIRVGVLGHVLLVPGTGTSSRRLREEEGLEAPAGRTHRRAEPWRGRVRRHGCLGALSDLRGQRGPMGGHRPVAQGTAAEGQRRRADPQAQELPGDADP